MCVEIIEIEILREVIPQMCRIETVLGQRAQEPRRRRQWFEIRTRLDLPQAAHDQEVQRQDRRVKKIRRIECR